jgi:hypothetical protein
MGVVSSFLFSLTKLSRKGNGYCLLFVIIAAAAAAAAIGISR